MNNQNSTRPLWAPWRIEYILSDKDGKCFLCNRKKKKDSHDEYMIIKRGERVFMILNAFPYISGHLMIAPYEHIGDLSELPKETLYELMDYSVIAKDLLKKTMSPDGFNIGFNLGYAAGAGLEDHLHMHIVPRWKGDTNFMSILGETRVIPQALHDTGEILRKNL